MELKKHLTPKGFREQLIYASLESMLRQAPPLDVVAIVVLELAVFSCKMIFWGYAQAFASAPFTAD